jgi:NADPH2:quinone reductase
MSMEIHIHEKGGSHVLRQFEVAPVEPGHNTIAIDQKAIGVNFLDIMHRTGGVEIPLPSGLGLEAAGTISAVGSGVTGFKTGDRVAYVLGPPGAYAEKRTISADRVVLLPDDISFDMAATVLLKGLTAQYLLKSTYHVEQATIILLYGVGGALGSVMAPWAKHLGATVIGVVSNDKSVDRARRLGCDEVLVWGQGDVAEQVATFTKGKMADVVYDGLGKLSFDASLNSLRKRGVMVSIGASTGAIPPIEITKLNKGSLFLTRPGLADHVSDLAEYKHRVSDVFDAVSKGVFYSAPWKVYPLNEVVAAHDAIENGQSAGPIILKP